MKKQFKSTMVDVVFCFVFVFCFALFVCFVLLCFVFVFQRARAVRSTPTK